MMQRLYIDQRQKEYIKIMINNSQFLIYLVILIKIKKNNKQKLQKSHHNWNLKLIKDEVAKSQNFDLISIEEMEYNFKVLKAKSEIFEAEIELLKLLENSKNNISFDEKEKDKEGIRIKRPSNIFYKIKNYIIYNNISICIKKIILYIMFLIFFCHRLINSLYHISFLFIYNFNSNLYINL